MLFRLSKSGKDAKGLSSAMDGEELMLQGNIVTPNLDLMRLEFNRLAGNAAMVENVQFCMEQRKAPEIAAEWLSRVRSGSLGFNTALTMCALLGHIMGLSIVKGMVDELGTQNPS